MKQPIDEPKSIQLAELIKDTFEATFTAVMMGEVPDFELKGIFKMGAEDLLNELDQPVIMEAKATDADYTAGLISPIQHITSVADTAMMGSGQSHDDLENTLDMIKELTDQVLASLTVPIQNSFKQQIKYAATDPTQFMAVEQLSIGDCIAIRVEGKRKGEEPLQLIMYMDNAMYSAITGVGAVTKDKSSSEYNRNLEVLLDVDIPVSIRMGEAKLFLKDVLGLGPGNVIELDQSADDHLTLTINNKPLAKGEVVIVDGYFGFKISEIVSKEERIRSLKG